MTAILGLYEFSGSADNPTILEMAKVCGGQIAKTYKHDSIAWCALTVNYCLVASGFPGNDSLWALDMAKYGVRLSGPAVGAIGAKTRNGGGHTFMIAGKTASGRLVIRGGNQSDMVCDETIDPDEVVAYSWPKGYPVPATGMGALPVITPLPHTHKAVTLPAPVGKPTSVPPVLQKPAAPVTQKIDPQRQAGGLLNAIYNFIRSILRRKS